MTCQDILPHLNKLAKIGLKNNKRKTGWLVCEWHQEPSVKFTEVHCLSPRNAKKFFDSELPSTSKRDDEIIPIDDIRYIRSIK